MTNKQKIYKTFNFYKTLNNYFFVVLAFFIAIAAFGQFSPTIAHAETNNPYINNSSNRPKPVVPVITKADSVQNTATNGGKPINVCGVISTCPTWIDTFKTSSSTPDTLAKSVVKLILIFVYFAIYVSAAVAALLIVFSGYRYITSQGDEKNTKPALETLKNAVIGFVLAVLSITIVTFLGNFLTSFSF